MGIESRKTKKSSALTRVLGFLLLITALVGFAMFMKDAIYTVPHRIKIAETSKQLVAFAASKGLEYKVEAIESNVYAEAIIGRTRVETCLPTTYTLLGTGFKVTRWGVTLDYIVLPGEGFDKLLDYIFEKETGSFKPRPDETYLVEMEATGTVLKWRKTAGPLFVKEMVLAICPSSTFKNSVAYLDWLIQLKGKPSQ